MIRLLTFLALICVALPIASASASFSSVTAAAPDRSCHDRTSPAPDHQSPHACLGCAIPSPSMELPAPLLPRQLALHRHSKWQLDGFGDGIDPPPPRRLG
jgi:hypothetical protein